MLYPLILKPVYKDYLWGGTKLKSIYNKDSETGRIAESWELACHKEGMSIITNGEYAGLSFSEYLKKEGCEVLGEGLSELPLIIKLIDSSDNLSVQVHPDDAYAKEHENGQEGKVEFWYIIDCEEDASLYFGFSNATTKEEFLKKAKDGTIPQLLNRVKVKRGDAILVPPGIIHAIGRDMTLVEVGTNSNITYRIYDFGRFDSRGNPRPLHLEKALDVLSFHPSMPEDFASVKSVFNVDIIRTAETDIIYERADKKVFHNYINTEGTAVLEYKGGSISIAPGVSVFIPAGMGDYKLKGNAVLLKVTV